MANNVVHWEVNGKDGPALHKFFGDLFDWDVSTDNPMSYGVVSPSGDGPGIGGGIGQTFDGSSGFVTFYVGVDDVTAALEKAASLGGSILMPEMNVMEGVTIGHFADPEGHIIGLVKNEPM